MEKKLPILPQYQIEGLDTNRLLSKIVDTDANGETSSYLYMRANPAFAWFYTVFPRGCMNHVLPVLNDRKATVTASVYRDVDDTRPAATATCTRYYDDTVDGRSYEQNATTAAYKKALAYLGFNTPIDAQEVDGIEVVEGYAIPERGEAGMPISSPNIPRPTPPVAAPAQPTEEPKRTRKSKKNVKVEEITPEEPKTEEISIEEFEPSIDTALLEDVDFGLDEAEEAEIAEIARKASESIAPVKDEDYEELLLDSLTEPLKFDKEAAFNCEPEIAPDKEEKSSNGPISASAAIPTPAIPNVVPNVVIEDKPKTTETTPPTFEEALQEAVPVGRAAGKTIEATAVELGDSMIRYLLDKCRVPLAGSRFVVAAEVFCKEKNI